MNPHLTETWQEELRLAMAKASTDAAFREALIKTPRETLETQAGMALPDGFQPLFVDRQENAVVIQLPVTTGEFHHSRFKKSWILCTKGLPPGPNPHRVFLWMLALAMFLITFLFKKKLRGGR